MLRNFVDGYVERTPSDIVEGNKFLFDEAVEQVFVNPLTIYLLFVEQKFVRGGTTVRAPCPHRSPLEGLTSRHRGVEKQLNG